MADIISDSYLACDWVYLWQAFYPPFFCNPAIFLAKSTAPPSFLDEPYFYAYAMTLVLPVLVAVFGILSVYGQTGWLAKLCQLLGFNYTFSPYGLKGILLACFL